MQTSIGQVPAFGKEPFPTTSAQSTSAPNAPTSGSTSSATVTANDFLQLLVTEMKNQDPTANTDPNQYINQLVQVNSLEQLVQINQDLGGSSSKSAGSGASGSTSPSPAMSASAAAQGTAAGGAESGNLPLPGSSAAAARVAQALQVPSTAAAPANLQSLVPAGDRKSATGPNFSIAR